MLIFLFNIKPLIGLFKANIHYATMAFIFEGHSTIVIFNSELHPAITISSASFGMRSDAFLLRSSQLKDNSPALTCSQAVSLYQVNFISATSDKILTREAGMIQNRKTNYFAS